MRHLPRRLAVRSFLVPAALALVLVTGCGDSGAPSADPPATGQTETQVDTRQSLAAVQAAPDATREAGSARIELTSETNVGAETVSITGSGAFDNAAQSGRLDLDVPQAGGTIQQRIVGGTIYLSLPQQPEVFYSLSVEDVAGTSLGGSSDPTASFEALRAASEDVREVGAETVRDVETTHYTGTFRVDDAIAQAQGRQKKVIESTFGALGLESIPFEVYLDDEGRVRRFVQTLDVPASEQTGGQPLTSVTTVDVFEFGTTVDVQAPPADQVKDGAPLLEALGGGRGGGGGGAGGGGGGGGEDATPPQPSPTLNG